jgi:uncharacterized protein YggT (Ycf19 family)
MEQWNESDQRRRRDAQSGAPPGSTPARGDRIVACAHGGRVIHALNLVYALAAFSLLLLAGQGMVRLLSFGRHEENAVYRFMRFLTSPVVKVVRFITPKKVADMHVPVVAFFLLFWICLALAVILPRMVAGAAA